MNKNCISLGNSWFGVTASCLWSSFFILGKLLRAEANLNYWFFRLLRHFVVLVAQLNQLLLDRLHLIHVVLVQVVTHPLLLVLKLAVLYVVCTLLCHYLGHLCLLLVQLI